MNRALVTGANRGIGRALVEEFARRRVPVVAGVRDPAATAPYVAPGALVEIAELDVLAPASIAIPADVDVVVNNAGIETAYLPLEHADTGEWRALFETNVLGLVEVTRRAVPVLRAGGGGVICNLTSSSILVPMPFFGAYRASKAAVSALTGSLRAEVAPFGIRVLEVLPGPVRTDMLAASARVPEAAEHPGYEEAARDAHAGRMAVDDLSVSAAEAAAAIVTAIADPSSGPWITCDPLGEQLVAGWLADPGSAR